MGGATGRIGDPSGRTTERALLDEATLERNVRGVEACLRLFDDQDGPAFKIVNNFDWYRSMDVLSFLRDVGKHYRLGTMLAKVSLGCAFSLHNRVLIACLLQESVRSRMSRDDSEGMSFTEFSYQVNGHHQSRYLHFSLTIKLRAVGAAGVRLSSTVQKRELSAATWWLGSVGQHHRWM